MKEWGKPTDIIYWKGFPWPWIQLSCMMTLSSVSILYIFISHKSLPNNNRSVEHALFYEISIQRGLL